MTVTANLKTQIIFEKGDNLGRNKVNFPSFSFNPEGDLRFQTSSKVEAVAIRWSDHVSCKNSII